MVLLEPNTAHGRSSPCLLTGYGDLRQKMPADVAQNSKDTRHRTPPRFVSALNSRRRLLPTRVCDVGSARYFFRTADGSICTWIWRNVMPPGLSAEDRYRSDDALKKKHMA